MGPLSATAIPCQRQVYLREYRAFVHGDSMSAATLLAEERPRIAVASIGPVTADWYIH
jgi:hypothetical protein